MKDKHGKTGLQSFCLRYGLLKCRIYLLKLKLELEKQKETCFTERGH